MNKIRFLGLKVLITAAVLSLLSSCTLVSSFMQSDEGVTLSFDKDNASLSIGAMDVINLSVSKDQSSKNISWSFDDTIISAKTDNYGAVITGLAPGKTKITASSEGSSASCYINVSSSTYIPKITSPYVYASSDYVDIKPAKTVRVSASLFGGTSADSQGFSWSIDKPSIATIASEGSYCWITGVREGNAKVTVRHSKSSYGYSILINCSSDGTKLPYITTQDNIVSINMTEDKKAVINAELKNLFSNDDKAFGFAVVDGSGNIMADAPVNIAETQGSSCTLNACKSGSCFVRISHPAAVYSLDVLVRVIQDAQNAYIEPSSTLLTISGKTSQTVSFELMNYKGETDPSLFSYTFSENAKDYISYEIYNGSTDDNGDKIKINGIKTGSVKITASYPGIPSRSIIVLVRDIESQALDTCTYITTDQNYVRLGLDDNEFRINVTLKNCAKDDIKLLKWNIVSEAKDGSHENVIEWIKGSGKAVFSSRSAIQTLSYCETSYAIIKALKSGTAYITLSHPKALYSTTINVTVTEGTTKTAPESFLALTDCPVINIKNGDTDTVLISFSGKGKTDDISWTVTSGTAKVQGNGTQGVISAPSQGSGKSKSSLKVTHPNAAFPLFLTVNCYDTDEQKESVKSIYSTQTHETIDAGSFQILKLLYSGFDSVPDIKWECVSGLNSVVNIESESTKEFLKVNAVSPGKAVIKASCSECNDVNFVITVKNEGVVDPQIDPYLSTSDNVLYFKNINDINDISVIAHNIDTSSYDKIKWECSSSDFSVSANGNSASVTALSEQASAILKISHPSSLNTLQVNLKSGNKYEYVNPDACYITADKETLELYEGQDEQPLTVKLCHTQKTEDAENVKGFTFESSAQDIAEVSYIQNTNICYIKPVSQGTAKVIVRHPDSDYEKEVIVIVKKAINSDSIPYISTEDNVLTVVQGELISASVSLKNLNSPDIADWFWKSLDPKIASIVASNGSTAMIRGNKSGTVELSVSHKKCIYPLKLIITCIDSAAAKAKPYITLSDDIITLQRGKSTTLTASMIGSLSKNDEVYFRWAASNNSVILINGTASSCFIKALNTGMSYITVQNSMYPDSYSKTALVIVEDDYDNDCFIKPSQNIIKLKPDDKNLTLVSATLVNGEATDVKDFIWWADDYNIIGITSVAEQCSITPTGRSGFTKLHVKHPKSSKVSNIVVMVSNYETFAFSTPSASIIAGKLNFFSLQVPPIGEDYKILYSSSSEDVCIIDGSSSTAFVCGQGYGSATLTAALCSNDGTKIAEAQMLVNVSVDYKKLPTISLGQSIITLEAGSSKTFSASIKGDDISETEKFNLKWSIQNPDSGISLLDSGADGCSFGSECYISVSGGGKNEYVLNCTHEKSGAVSSMYIVVEEKGAMAISLSSYYEEIYKDDGSITLTATLTNASDSDYKTIEWSALRVKGQAVVSVSKAKGKTCTVTPRATGTTTVVAKLPNGKTARCTIVVKSLAEISVSTQTVRVIPGYTEVVKYTVTPENAVIEPIVEFSNYSSSLTGSFIKYFEVENDSSNHQLLIKGLKEYPSSAAGTVMLTMVGASSANMPKLTVFCQYNIELDILDMDENHIAQIQNTRPDTANIDKFKIRYYPSDLIISVDCGGNGDKLEDGKLVSVGSKSVAFVKDNGVEKAVMTLSLIPHSEGERDIIVTACLPKDSQKAFTKKKSFHYAAYYDSYDIIADFSKTPEGAFTTYKNNILSLSDGEEALFSVRIANENATGQITDIQYKNNTESNEYNNNENAYKLKEKSREEKRQTFFKNNSEVPSKPLIYFQKEDNSSTSEVFYRFGHAWDYYEDIKTKRETPYNAKYPAYDPDCLKNSSANWYLVSKELVIKNKEKSKFFYTVPHKNINPQDVDICKWITGVSDNSKNPDKPNYMITITTYNEYMTAYSELNSLLWHENHTGVDYHSDFDWSGEKNGNIYYVDCIPYVISRKELENHSFFVLPKTKLYYKKKTHIKYNKDDDDTIIKEDTITFNKMVNRFITPTTEKSPNDCISASVNASPSFIQVSYTDGHGKSKTDKKITVRFAKRMCEAYTNGHWHSETVVYPNSPSKYVHYVLDDKVFDRDLSLEPLDYLSIDKTGVDAKFDTIKTNQSVLYVPYKLRPKEDTLIVTIPKNTLRNNIFQIYCQLILEDGSYSNKTSDSKANYYYITNHSSVTNGEASGIIKFACTDQYGRPINNLAQEYCKPITVQTIISNTTKYIFFNLHSL